MKIIATVLSVAFLATLPRPATAADNGLQVTRTYQLGGAGGWDYMTFDAASRRLYVTRGDHLMVMDGDSGKLVADIAGMSRSHGVALVPAMQTGYVSNGQSDSVAVIDLTTLKVKSQIPVGKGPDAIIFDPSTKHVFVFDGHSNEVSVIDPAAGKVIATIAAPGRPEFAASDGKGHVFFNLEDKNKLTQLDAKAAKVLNTWSLGTCDSPSGLAIDAAHERLFSVCANKQMVVLDGKDGHIVTTVPIGDGPDAAAFDAATATVYSSNSDGTLTVIHEDDADHYSVVANVATPKRARTLAVDPQTHNVYLATAKFGTPPPATAAEPKPRAPMEPDSFAIVVVGKH
ncbi:MAG TPA: YncE family protein [Xanthomonadaceae bacterium]|jgi:YVTN family beta-propeller protein|nr:YncE family protein [Xanthomonadaceae bacterium]